MKIIPHRGVWQVDTEKNQLSALLCAMDRFDGVELDLRNSSSELIIAHDPFEKKTVLLEAFLASLNDLHKKKFIAFNIKADGLANHLLTLVTKYKILNYMIFDTSFPESLKYKALLIPVFNRVSDIEELPVSFNGLVVDCFEKEINLPDSSRSLFLISPELHGRSHLNFWAYLKKSHASNSKLLICTDLPDDFKLFWNQND